MSRRTLTGRLESLGVCFAPLCRPHRTAVLSKGWSSRSNKPVHRCPLCVPLRAGFCVYSGLRGGGYTRLLAPLVSSRRKGGKYVVSGHDSFPPGGSRGRQPGCGHPIKHLFRRGILAAARGTFQVCTLPALPFEEFVNVVGDIRPPEEPPSSQVAKSISDTGEWL